MDVIDVIGERRNKPSSALAAGNATSIATGKWKRVSPKNGQTITAMPTSDAASSERRMSKRRRQRTRPSNPSASEMNQNASPAVVSSDSVRAWYVANHGSCS